jgi:hypothetical protein
MTRKKKLIILLSAAVGVLLVALLIWLMCLPGIRGYREMAVEFYDAHRVELQAAQLALQDNIGTGKNPVWIDTVEELGSDYQNDGVTVRRYHDLYIISKEEYPEATYQMLYEVAQPLFHEGLSGISVSSYQIQFCVKSSPSIGREASLVWSDGTHEPSGSYPTVLEKQQLDTHWFALVVSD